MGRKAKDYSDLITVGKKAGLLKNMKTTRKIPREDEEQKSVFSWWSEKAADLQLWEGSMFHVPNGTQAASRMKKRGLGVRSGVPDIFLSLSRHGYHGLYLELKKRKGGRLSAEQKDFIEESRRNGYAAFCAEGAENAIDLITRYLSKNFLFDCVKMEIENSYYWRP